MKLQLYVDYGGGSIDLESTDHGDLLDASTVLHQVAVGSGEDEVSVPVGGQKYTLIRVGQIDRVDLTWEA